VANLTVASAVGRLNTAIGALAGWTVPPLPVGLMAEQTRQMAHQVAHAFAARTEIDPSRPSGRRQGVAVGAYARTHVVVEYLWRIRPDAYAADIAEAYDGEADLIAALVAVSLVDLQVVFSGADRVVADDRRHLAGSVRIVLTHSIALA